MTSWHDRILTLLGGLRGSFEPDALAFLALSQKPEFVVRDALAWRLHQRTADGYLIAREWHRYDLAALDGAGAPVMVLEAKAAYTFDQASGMKTHHSGAIERDIQKLRQVPAADRFELVVNVHPAAAVPDRLLDVVKYARGINRALSHATADELLAATRHELTTYLGNFGDVDRIPLDAGTAWGIPVTVDLYLASLR
jgi:hypothetical protein